MTTITQAPTGKPEAESIKSRKVDVTGGIFKFLLWSALAFTILVLVVVITDLLQAGWAVLSTRMSDFLTSNLSSNAAKAGIAQGIAGTITIALITAVISFPIGIGAALYLEEYARPGRFTQFIDINIRNLSGVPSVVYGILGFTILVKALGRFTGGASVLAGGITLAILVLPIVIISSAEAIRAVPQSLREGGYGVGANRWEVVRSMVLPSAMPGILTGTILALARAMGEAAPLILIGANQGFFSGGEFGDLTGRFTALPITIFQWTKQPSADWVTNTAAAIVVLLIMVLFVNATAILLRNHFEKTR